MIMICLNLRIVCIIYIMRRYYLRNSTVLNDIIFAVPTLVTYLIHVRNYAESFSTHLNLEIQSEYAGN